MTQEAALAERVRRTSIDLDAGPSPTHRPAKVRDLLCRGEAVPSDKLESEVMYRAAIMARSKDRVERMEGVKTLLALYLRRTAGSKAPKGTRAAKAVKSPLDGALPVEAPPAPDPAKVSPSTWSAPQD